MQFVLMFKFFAHWFFPAKSSEAHNAERDGGRGR